MKEKILITGGSGMLGSEIRKRLEQKGFETGILSRNKKTGIKNSFYWNYKTGKLDPAALKFADIIIHLAGENISHKRWTTSQKKEIYNSRVLSTKLLYDKMKESGNRPKKFISASAIGFYGTETSEKIFTEEDGKGNDFLSKVVHDWEKEVQKLNGLGIDTLIYRLGIIFSPRQAALKEMMKPLQFKLGFPVGSGQQYLAWVSLQDAAEAFIYAINKKEMKGIYNLVSPNPLKQKDLMKYLSQKKHAFYLPISFPSFLLYLSKGEMADILVKGSRVSSQKIIKEGFIFQQGEIEDLF